MKLSEALSALDGAVLVAKAKPLTPSEITSWALAHGWSLVRNKLTRTSPDGRTYRLVLNDLKVRYELRVDYSDGTHNWLRLTSGYYKNLRIGSEGLEGLTR